jgi:predicted nucleic acid-binding Zn ribbon protein
MMSDERRTHDRRRGGFRRLDRGSLAAEGMPRKRVRELLLAEAWRRVAGDALSRRAEAEAVRRGVLEIRVTDPRWIDPLTEMIPRLAARLAQRYPELAVKRFRLRVEGEESGPQPLPSVPPVEPEAPRATVAPAEPAPPGDRLETVASRYLAKVRERGNY